MSRPQVVSWAPGMTTPRWLGQYGPVSALNYSYACPGGCDQLTCTLWRDARFRADGMNPGRIVQVMVGASVVWEGIMLEPAPSTSGWTITAVGNGSWGTNFRAVYSVAWGSSPSVIDDVVNQAISRGLRWVNPGIGFPGGAWLGQQVDSGAQTVTDMLNLVCSNGGLTWYVGRQNVLSVFQLPTVPTRQIINTNPVARTLSGNLNTVYERYMTAADVGSAAAQFALTVSQDTASVAQFGTPLEEYVDLSSANGGSVPLSSAAAQAVGTAILQRYLRATFSGPFTIRQGQLLTVGGQPCDIAQEQAGSVMRMLMTDYTYGAEESVAPVTFLVGAYAYDDDSQTAQVTPFQYLNASDQEIVIAPWVTAALPPPPSFAARPGRVNGRLNNPLLRLTGL